MKRSGCLWEFIALNVIFVIGACVIPLPLDVEINFLLGWAFFLYRVIPGLHVSWSGLVTALVCLVTLAFGLHATLRWLARSMPRESGAVIADWPRARSLCLLGLIVLSFTAGVGAVGVTHQASWLINSPEPWVQSDFQAAVLRTQSQNNLKQMGLAFHNHDKAFGHLPPGGTFDPAGGALHGWQTALLPYIGEEGLYRSIDLQRPWHDPANAAAFGTVVKTYLYPRAEPQTANGYALSHYAANSRVLGGDRVVKLSQFGEKGTSNIILVGEAAGNFKPWGHHANWRDPVGGFNRSPDGFGSPSGKEVVNFVMADGSVRPFLSDADPEFVKLLAGSSGEE